jgi:hypothetical protein
MTMHLVEHLPTHVLPDRRRFSHVATVGILAGAVVCAGMANRQDQDSTFNGTPNTASIQGARLLEHQFSTARNVGGKCITALVESSLYNKAYLSDVGFDQFSGDIMLKPEVPGLSLLPFTYDSGTHSFALAPSAPILQFAKPAANC